LGRFKSETRYHTLFVRTKGHREAVLVHFVIQVSAQPLSLLRLAVSVSTYITAETPRTRRLRRDLKLNQHREASEPRISQIHTDQKSPFIAVGRSDL